MSNIREKIKDSSRFANLEHSIANKANRSNPGSNRVSSVAGWSGEQTYRKTSSGAIMHGMKFGTDWMYRKYTTTGEDDWDIDEHCPNCAWCKPCGHVDFCPDCLAQEKAEAYGGEDARL